MQRVNFHLTDEQLAWLRGRQESTGVPAAEQIRRAIDRERAMTKTITKQERNQAVRNIAAVLLDGQRIDRYVRLDSDGKPYTTDAAEYIGPGGPYNTPYVRCMGFSRRPRNKKAPEAT